MTATIERTQLRQQMLDACIVKQQSLLKDFTNRIKLLLKSEGLGNEEAYDNAELAATSQKIREANLLNEALVFASKEMEVLEKIQATNDIIREKASLGAVVVTDRNTFFVSVSIEKFSVNGQLFIGLSVQSPLFQAMNGKGKGEHFTYKGKVYHIKEVF